MSSEGKVEKMARTRREIEKLHRKKERRLEDRKRHPQGPEPLEGKEEPKRKSKGASRSKSKKE
jgi:hypothetical protein